jgi:ubiquinone biosynthesis protein COQ9
VRVPISLVVSVTKNSRKVGYFSGRHCSSSSTSSTSFTSESHFHNPDESELALRDRILQSALLHVSQRGWTDSCLQAGAHTLGLPEHVAAALFPRGGIQLVCHFYEISNAKMGDQMKMWTEADKTGVWDVKADLDAFGGIPPQIVTTNDFLGSAIRYRLSLLKPVLKTWDQAMALMSLPNNADLVLPLFRELLDEMLHESGDKSVDMSWYTKRVSLGLIYGSTELFMLQDESLNHDATWKFLQHRIDDLKSFNSGYGSLSIGISALGQAASAAPSLLRNMLGFR